VERLTKPVLTHSTRGVLNRSVVLVVSVRCPVKMLDQTTAGWQTNLKQDLPLLGTHTFFLINYTLWSFTHLTVHSGSQRNLCMCVCVYNMHLKSIKYIHLKWKVSGSEMSLYNSHTDIISWVDVDYRLKEMWYEKHVHSIITVYAHHRRITISHISFRKRWGST